MINTMSNTFTAISNNWNSNFPFVQKMALAQFEQAKKTGTLSEGEILELDQILKNQSIPAVEHDPTDATPIIQEAVKECLLNNSNCENCSS